MRLTALTLRGYHGFRDLELKLPESGPTVLIGKNGSGKSTILDAIALFLAHFAALATNPSARRKPGASLALPISPAEVHRELQTAKVSASFSVADVKDPVFARATSERGPLRLSRRTGTLISDYINDSLIPSLAKKKSISIPVLAYYRPDRGIGQEPEKKAKAPAYPQLMAYTRALEARVGPFQAFVGWFRQREDRENETRLRANPSHRDKSLQAVRDAIERFLSELSPGTFHDLRIVRGIEPDTGADLPSEIVIDKGNINLSLSDLSDGERGALLLVADIAMRLCIANPGAKDPLSGAGIILIDELEMHLHPAWQRAILPGLTRVFPGCQFIATTHSPQVISMLDPSAVIVLRDFQRVEVTPHTLGRDTNSILRDVMDTPSRPQAAAEKLSRIARLIDAESYGEARAAIDDLSNWLGDLDPEIVRLRALTDAMEL